MIFEALNAAKGDCLVLRFVEKDDLDDDIERLWIIDGGPNPVWKTALVPHLAALRKKVPCFLELGVVSHIDDDHIFGLDKLIDDLANGTRPDMRFERFWFNAFEKVMGMPAGAGGAPASVATVQALGDDWLAGLADPTSAAITVQSFAQGDRLAGNLKRAGIPTNSEFGDLVMAGVKTPVSIGAQKVTVLGPRPAHVDALRKEWAAAWAQADAKARKAALQALFGKPDASVPNLSSIVMFVESGKSKLLLTGDALGNDIVDAWEQDLELPKGPVPVDILKLPHHGSNRNVSERFLAKFPARHYVFSADGTHENPDPGTIEAVVAACGDREATLHFTNGGITWEKPYRLEKGGAPVLTLAELLVELAAARPGRWTHTVRGDGEDCIRIPLP